MGVIYYITIPSMYLFLTIYSVFNLNVVSWGTREVPKKKTADEMEQVPWLGSNTVEIYVTSFMNGPLGE